LAVNAAAATPLLFVVTEIVAVPFEKVPLAPLLGAWNVTDTPLKGLLAPSVTLACSDIAKAVLIAALCGVPPATVMIAATPGLFVRLKLAGVVTPEAVAVTA
jgi:hypothetical protein